VFGVIAAVNVTAWLTVDMPEAGVRATVGAAWFTVCVDALLAPELKLESPLYAAVTELEPAISAEVLHVAWLFVTVTPVQAAIAAAVPPFRAV
jgi:hypothetical protein